MLVIADASPLIALIKIGHTEVLPKLFGSIAIPPEVARELADQNRPAIVREWIAAAPSWLSIRAAKEVRQIPEIDLGEMAAISLAIEVRADLILIDDNRGRRAAIGLGLKTARTGAILFEAANSGALADLRAAFESLRATNFRIPPAVLEELLRQHEQLRPRNQP